VIGAIEGEVAQGGELGFDSVESGTVGRGVGEFDVVPCPELAPGLPGVPADRGLCPRRGLLEVERFEPVDAEDDHAPREMSGQLSGVIRGYPGS
jgi:hypothetical protein